MLKSTKTNQAFIGHKGDNLEYTRKIKRFSRAMRKFNHFNVQRGDKQRLVYIGRTRDKIFDGQSRCQYFRNTMQKSRQDL